MPLSRVRKTSRRRPWGAPVAGLPEELPETNSDVADMTNCCSQNGEMKTQYFLVAGTRSIENPCVWLLNMEGRSQRGA